MYFSINFNMEAQAQDTQWRKRPAAQVQDAQVTSAGFQGVSSDLTLAGWCQQGYSGIPETFVSFGPSPQPIHYVERSSGLLQGTLRSQETWN